MYECLIAALMSYGADRPLFILRMAIHNAWICCLLDTLVSLDDLATNDLWETPRCYVRNLQQDIPSEASASAAFCRRSQELH